MALADETDPVQAMKDLLDASAAGDWSNTGAKPSDIEKTETTERRIKEERSGDAVYLHSRLETDHRKAGADGSEADEVAVVTVECWSKTGAGQAEALKRDVLSIVADKANDSNSSTAWVDWWPNTSEDFRAQSAGARRADHYIETVSATLRDLRSI